MRLVLRMCERVALPTPIPHKHVNGRGRYMAAVCYTCYRPARTGYVRQSIALILALGAAHRWWLCAPRCRPYSPFTPSARSPALGPSPRRPLQQLHHRVITSTPSRVNPLHRHPSASPPPPPRLPARARRPPRSPPKSQRASTRVIIAEFSKKSREKTREIDAPKTPRASATPSVIPWMERLAASTRPRRSSSEV